MSIQDTLAEDLAATAFDLTASETPSETVQITHAGTPYIGPGVFIHNGVEKRQTKTGMKNVTTATLMVQMDKFPVAAINDVVTRAAEEWTIDEMATMGGACWKLEVIQVDQTELSRPDYRG